MIEAPQLSIGEIADRAVTMIVTRWRPLLALALFASVPIALVYGFVPKADTAKPGGVLLLLLAAALIYLVAVPAIFAVLRNDAGDARSAVMWGFACVGPTIRAFFASSFVYAALFLSAMIVWIPLIFIVTVVFVIGGAIDTVPAAAKLTPVLAIAGVIPALLLIAIVPPLWLCTSVMYPIVIYERTGAWAAFGLAWRTLVAPTRMRGWLIGVAIIAMTQVPTYAIGELAELVNHFMPNQQWATAIASVATTPFSLLLDLALSYVIAQNMLARLRGSDIELELDAPTDGLIV